MIDVVKELVDVGGDRPVRRGNQVLQEQRGASGTEEGTVREATVRVQRGDVLGASLVARFANREELEHIGPIRIKRDGKSQGV